MKKTKRFFFFYRIGNIKNRRETRFARYKNVYKKGIEKRESTREIQWDKFGEKATFEKILCTMNISLNMRIRSLNNTDRDRKRDINGESVLARGKIQKKQRETNIVRKRPLKRDNNEN